MSVSKHQIQAASRWLNDLADLTAGSQPLSEAKTKLAAMTPALAEEFDASAFNRNSLLFVARRCKFFPSFSEAYEALTEWRHDHPAPSHRSAIAGPESANETARLEAERAEAEASWRNISEPQIFAKVRAINEIKSPTVRLINGQFLATAVRRYAPRMLGLLPPEFLTANDDRSAA